MKNLLTIAFILTAFISNAQSEKVEQYCEVLGTSGTFSSKVTINIDLVMQKAFGKIIE